MKKKTTLKFNYFKKIKFETKIKVSWDLNHIRGICKHLKREITVTEDSQSNKKSEQSSV